MAANPLGTPPLRQTGTFVGRKRKAKLVAQSTPSEPNIEVARPGRSRCRCSGDRLTLQRDQTFESSDSEALRGRDMRRSRKRTRRRDTGLAAHCHAGSSSPDPAAGSCSAVIGGAPMPDRRRRKKLASATNGPSVRSWCEMPGFSPDHSTAKCDRLGHSLLPVYLQLMRAHAASR